MGPQNKSLTLKHFSFAIPLMASAGLLACGMSFLQPFSFSDNSYADSKNTAVSLRIGESIMVPEVSTDSINIELDPTAANGDFKTASVIVGVSTNRTAGYTLTASVEGSETSLTNADYDNYEIAALSSKTSADDFADLSKTASMNKWGYATDNNGDGDGQTEAGYYYAMPDVDNPTTLKITDGPAATSNTEVTFATKGKDLAAGKYENTVVFTAIGNLEPAPTMQNFTAEQCNALVEWGSDGSEGSTTSLMDSRDDNEYQIRKLADGHCWMIENLHIIGKKLTMADSDTSGNFTIPSSNSTWCTNSGSSCIDTIKVYYNKNPATYGAYYNWYTATAGAGTYSINTDGASVGTSICPKGWKLPLGTTATYSWYYLYNSGYGADMTTFRIATNTGSDYWAGRYHGEFRDYGDRGYWWSRTAASKNIAYFMSTYSPKATEYGKYEGFSVRCVFVGT